MSISSFFHDFQERLAARGYCVSERTYPHQRPLIEPDVRFSRIRLTDDLSPPGIHKELTARLCK
jgi:hypothetical protein